jgi:hypothetical protein
MVGPNQTAKVGPDQVAKSRRPSSERQRDFNPPEQRAAKHALRASPPPHTARPGSRELPVDRDCDHRWGFPCCVWSPLRACRRHYPGRYSEVDSLVFLHPHRPSPKSRRVGSCIEIFEACSAFTHGRKSRLRYWDAGYDIEKFDPIAEHSEFSDHLAGAVLP